jgi:FtsP/CotA-like multicopper oxidase with cupredoxin domain
MAALLEPNATDSAANFTLQIAPTTVELAPQVIINTIGYCNKVPGPLLRVREGQRVAVEVVNDTDVPEHVHWHGLLVPSEVDGAEEEGTPPIAPHGRRRYQFVAKPAGSRWYHSHTAAMMDLHRGSYTGQFGFFIIDSRAPGPATVRSTGNCRFVFLSLVNLLLSLSQFSDFRFAD